MNQFVKSIFTGSSLQQKPSKQKKRGRKSKVSADVLRSQLNQNAKKIFKNGKLLFVSESKVYKKIASQLDKYSPQAVYQYAKRYFRPDHVSKANVNSETTDFIKSYDRHTLKPQQYTEFNVSIDGMPFFRDHSGKMKPMSDWSSIFRKIVFAMSQSPCAWSIQQPRMAGNEITLNGHCL